MSDFSLIRYCRDCGTTWPEIRIVVCPSCDGTRTRVVEDSPERLTEIELDVQFEEERTVDDPLSEIFEDELDEADARAGRFHNEEAEELGMYDADSDDLSDLDALDEEEV